MLWNKEQDMIVCYEVETNENLCLWLQEILDSLPNKLVEYTTTTPYFKTEQFPFYKGMLVRLGYGESANWQYITDNKVSGLGAANKLMPYPCSKAGNSISCRWSYKMAVVPDYFWSIWALQSNDYTFLKEVLLKQDETFIDKLKNILEIKPLTTLPYINYEQVVSLLSQEDDIFQRDFNWQKYIYELPLDDFKKEETFKVKVKG